MNQSETEHKKAWWLNNEPHAQPHTKLYAELHAKTHAKPKKAVKEKNH